MFYPQLSFMYVSFEKENARAQPVSLSRALSLTVKQTTPVSIMMRGMVVG